MAETDEAARSQLANRLELLGVLLIALTAVLTAWSAFQSSKWSGVMAIRFNEAGAARTESVRNSDIASGQLSIDVGLFTEFADAVAGDQAELADFYRARFPERLTTAVDAWLATDPLDSPGAPSSPFEMAEYELDAREQAADLEATAERRSTQARDANQTGDDYTVTSVAFATVILLAALSGKVDQRHLQIGLLVGAFVLFLGTVGVIATFPIEI